EQRHLQHAAQGLAGAEQQVEEEQRRQGADEPAPPLQGQPATHLGAGHSSSSAWCLSPSMWPSLPTLVARYLRLCWLAPASSGRRSATRMPEVSSALTLRGLLVIRLMARMPRCSSIGWQIE